MTILIELSSQVGDQTSQSNFQIAARCLAQPTLLDEIAGGLTAGDVALAGDCAEVFTEVARQAPDLVAPYAERLADLLAHKATRVRWEAMHALALSATAAPEVIASLLPRLADLIRHDTSVIVRDYAVDAIGGYAATGPEAARAAYPILLLALTVWDGRQVAHALNGLAQVVTSAPDLGDEVRAVGARYHDSGRSVVRKAARALIRAAEEL